ncbi:MAG: hypothetical protein E5V92_02295 [Mesorhizobium sp.]|uniref:hypothetical protein n=1 Tax=Mesorhizobium sp. TaxID=1871066 RepID=UPI000FE76309|nr:hypothetical protein [Mesorhizobium sp.]RWA94566.1 MAG: hypothetical protein EOQ32_12175 [Mesorhizobium sp.]RWE17529.1 MAG: hypothetical protein EOS61_02645 [Mesorhizobium sp.]TIV73145.1 MAG: hypothetical protein E5V89_01660 [Mesorhizobium sp.]TIW01307.1 MAG: hypothetical protein E5V85_00315 [Mesorhizobium sp.]TJW90215.1 MAG: hypothetical protein E5V92_02295 [Mesorhizobium sp.]
MQAIRNGVSWAGFASGPTAWAVSLQLDYAISDWQCHAGFRPTALFSLLAAAAVLAGIALSWRALRNVGFGISPPLHARTRRFLAGTSVGIGALFALAMLAQIAAGLIFSGCEL